MKPNKVLITGCAGFIGSNLAEHLVSTEGIQVVGLDNFDPYYGRDVKEANLRDAQAVADIAFEEGDIRDEAFLQRVFVDHAPDAIVHLAALAGVRPSVAQPDRYMDVNVTGTIRLLQMAQKHGVQRIVFASSSSVYGLGNQTPFAESQPTCTPMSPYAASKIGAEACCFSHHHLYDLPTVVLRYFTVFGPRQRPDLAIHKFTRQILSGETIQLFGDGSSSRDYTYVSDIVAGTTAALLSDVHWAVCNLGGCHPVTLAELVEALQEVLEREATIEWLPMQPGDMVRTCADVTRAKELLGWEAKVSLREGLKSFAEWFQREESGG